MLNHTLTPALILAVLLAADSPPATQPSPADSVAAEYALLLKRAQRLNTEHAELLNPWAMNGEHCLAWDSGDATRPRSATDEQRLRDLVIRFVRSPGALDFLFGRLLDPKVSPEEVLADAEFLVYAGNFQLHPGERLPPSTRAMEVLNAVRDGRFAEAEKRWPKAPVRQRIEEAATRAIEASLAATKPTH